MFELDYAISKEGGVTALAAALGVRQSVVSNWRMRGNVPDGWLAYLRLKYRIPKQQEKSTA